MIVIMKRRECGFSSREDCEMADRDARVQSLKKELEMLQQTHDESMRVSN